MKKLDTIEQVREHLRAPRREGRRIGLVPTMGALHEGHRSLIRAARGACDAVVVSIFVNPIQFGPQEDLTRYPRPLDADLAACESEGATAVFTPSAEEMYPPGWLTRVTVSRLTDNLCGSHRPGHFEGVTTVVAKLFNIVQPDVAFFGQKDAQQAIVIRRMTRDLDLPIEIRVCPIIRESDGLALSSRNVYLSAEERRRALSLSAALRWAREQVEGGVRDAGRLGQAMRERLMAAGVTAIDYVEIVDAEELTPKDTISGRCLVAIAAWVGRTRLIDNEVVEA